MSESYCKLCGKVSTFSDSNNDEYKVETCDSCLDKISRKYIKCYTCGASIDPDVTNKCVRCNTPIICDNC